MPQRSFTLLRRLFVVDYSPHPDEQAFLERAHSRKDGEVEATVAVPSNSESERLFGVRLDRHDLQVVWLEVANGANEPLWLDLVRLDPGYYTPLEAANVVRFALGKRLVAFGLLGWMFLPLLPLLPLKLFSTHSANQRLSKFFRSVGFPTGVIAPGKKASGFLFTRLDEGVKRIEVRLIGRSRSLDFTFTAEVPGLVLPHAVEDAAGAAEELDETALQVWLKQQPRCTGNATTRWRATLSTLRS